LRKKKNVRKSELAKMEANANSNMTDEENKKKFDALVDLISELQAKGSNPDIHKETKEDLKFELDSEKRQKQREDAEKNKVGQKAANWYYKIMPKNESEDAPKPEVHGPYQ